MKKAKGHGYGFKNMGEVFRLAEITLVCLLKQRTALKPVGFRGSPPARCPPWGGGGDMPPASGHGAGAQSPCTPSSGSAHPARAALPRLGCPVGPRFQTPLEALGPLVPLGQHGFDVLREKRPPATAIKPSLRENGSCFPPGDGKRN